jgi:hypothetical protein
MGPCTSEERRNNSNANANDLVTSSGGEDRDGRRHLPSHFQTARGGDGEIISAEEVSTMDPLQQQQENWTSHAVAEGYTLLENFDGPIQQFAFGPPSFMSDGDSGNEICSGNTGDDISIIAGSSTFHDAADIALLTLEEDYLQCIGATVSRDDENNSNHLDSSAAAETTVAINLVQEPAFAQRNDDDEDINIIAAAFDRRKEECQRIQEKGGFYVDWEGLQQTSSQNQLAVISATTTNEESFNHPSKKGSSIDANAVHKAVKALSINNKDTQFQLKFAAWQKKQEHHQVKQQNNLLIPDHALIPVESRKCFFQLTTEAIQETANVTRSATLAEAILRIIPCAASMSGGTAVDDCVNQNKDTLLVDIVGVDHVECASAEKIQNTLGPLIKWLITSQKTWQFRKIHFRLIGRDVMLPLQLRDQSLDLLQAVKDAESISSDILKEATATCHSSVYHEFLEELKPSNATDIHNSTPALVIAFNAGIWGYQEWEITIQFLARQRYDETGGPKAAIPFVVTAYTLSECQEDYHTIESATCTPTGSEASPYHARVLWKPEKNLYGSKVIRETQSSSCQYKENAYWQAWLLGG